MWYSFRWFIRWVPYPCNHKPQGSNWKTDQWRREHFKIQPIRAQYRQTDPWWEAGEHTLTCSLEVTAQKTISVKPCDGNMRKQIPPMTRPSLISDKVLCFLLGKEVEKKEDIYRNNILLWAKELAIRTSQCRLSHFANAAKRLIHAPINVTRPFLAISTKQWEATKPNLITYIMIHFYL